MNQFKTVALLDLLSVLITISYWIIGGWSGVLVGVAIAAVTNLGSWYFSERIALAAYPPSQLLQVKHLDCTGWCNDCAIALASDASNLHSSYPTS